MKRILQATLNTILMFAFIAITVGIIWGIVYLFNNYGAVMLIILQWILGICFVAFAWWINYKNITEPYNEYSSGLDAPEPYNKPERTPPADDSGHYK
jgi:hypothetical protein